MHKHSVLKRAQSFSEYAILLAVVAMAITAMQTYVKRGLQARLKDTADSFVSVLNDKLDSNYTNQYEPYYQNSTRDILQESLVQDSAFEGGREKKNYIREQTHVSQREQMRQ
jgi:Flp pilus assembly pilin Flp